MLNSLFPNQVTQRIKPTWLLMVSFDAQKNQQNTLTNIQTNKFNLGKVSD